MSEKRSAIFSGEDFVVVEYKESQGLKTDTSRSIARTSVSTDIISLKVHLTSKAKKLLPGDEVFVIESNYATKYGRQRLRLEGKEVILVPVSEIVAMRTNTSQLDVDWNNV